MLKVMVRLVVGETLVAPSAGETDDLDGTAADSRSTGMVKATAETARTVAKTSRSHVFVLRTVGDNTSPPL